MRLTGSVVVAFAVLTASAAFAADAAPAPDTFTTPWPARSPCTHPSTLAIDHWLKNGAVWSSADGATALKLSPHPLDKPIRLAPTFPGDRLTRVTVDELPKPLRFGWLLELGCRSDASIEWGPCAGDRCSVTATYRAPRMYKAWRTQHWTTRTRAPAPYDDWPDVHYSRFKQRIGWRKEGDPEIERQSLRLTRDMVADMRDCLAAACASGRCAEPIHAAESRLRAYLADRAVRYVLTEHFRAYDHWNTGWVWNATAGGTTLNVDCTDITESPEVMCSLELDVGDGLRVSFNAAYAAATRNADVIIVDRPNAGTEDAVGVIWFNDSLQAEGKILLEIKGRALALAPGPAAGAPAH